MAGESLRRSRRFSTGETLSLLSDEELLEAKIDPADRAVDLDSESENEFVAEGDFVDSSGSSEKFCYIHIIDNTQAPSCSEPNYEWQGQTPHYSHWEKMQGAVLTPSAICWQEHDWNKMSSLLHTVHACKTSKNGVWKCVCCVTWSMGTYELLTSSATMHAHELAYSIVMKIVQSYLKKGHIYTELLLESPTLWRST